MKRLIMTIMLAALVMSLAGCVVVDGRHHHGHSSCGVIVRPGPVVIAPSRPPYPYPPHHRGWRGR